MKEENERSHFVSKMRDQSGLPIWDKMITIKRPETANKGESGTGSEQYVIPLTENEKNLSSILFVTKYPDSSFAFKNVDNEKLKQDVFNPQLDKSYREQILLNFIVTDNLSFSKDAVYWNIPGDLLTFVPRDVTNPQGKFQIRTPVSNSGGSTTNLNDTCVTWVTNCTCSGSNCDLCNNGGQCVTHSVCLNGGGDGGYEGGPEGDAGYPGDPGTGGPPGDGGSGDGGGGGGNPSNPDEDNDCGGPNRPFYKVVPGCDDDGGIPENDADCDKAKSIYNNTAVKSRYNVLKQHTSDTNETGYGFRTVTTSGTNTTTQTTPLNPDATNVDKMKVGIYPTSFGYVHTHLDKTGNDQAVKILSPADINTFLAFLHNAKDHNVALNTIFGGMLASDPDTQYNIYQLQYLGNGSNLPTELTEQQVKNLTNVYLKEAQDMFNDNDGILTHSNLQKLVFGILKKMNLKDTMLFNIVNDKIKKITLDSNGNPSEETCP